MVQNMHYITIIILFYILYTVYYLNTVSVGFFLLI